MNLNLFIFALPLTLPMLYLAAKGLKTTVLFRLPTLTKILVR